MGRRKIRLWYDPEGDYLEVIFEQEPGCFRENENNQVIEKVDEKGNVLGFSVLNVPAATDRAPGITHATAGWASGNWSAAAASGTPWLAQTRSSRRARSRMAGGAGL